MDPRLRPQRADAVKWQVIDEEGILVHLETGFYFSLNGVGLYIWDRCDGQHSCRDIVDGLVEEFDVLESTALADMEGFLQELARENLVLLDEAAMPGSA